jgi:hypothetical protein
VGSYGRQYYNDITYGNNTENTKNRDIVPIKTNKIHNIINTNANFMEYLNDDEIILIALELDYKTITKLCTTNKYFNNKICNNDYFWYQKYIRDLDRSFLEHDDNYYNGNWKNLYRSSGSLYVSGSNKNSQLGLCDIRNRKQLTKLSIGNFYNKIKQVALGSTFTAVIDINNDLWLFGKLGSNLISNRPHNLKFKCKDIAAGDSHLLILDLNENVWLVGDNKFGQLGTDEIKESLEFLPLGDIKVKKIFAGENKSIIVDGDDNIWAAGKNKYGELGLGDTNNRYEFSSLSDINPDIKNVKNIVIESSHTIILEENGNIWVAGLNDNYQLGDDSYDQVSVFIIIPGIIGKQVAVGRDFSIIIDNNNDVWTSGLNNYQLPIEAGDFHNFTKLNFEPPRKFKDVVASGSRTFLTSIDNKIIGNGYNYQGAIPGNQHGRICQGITISPNNKNFSYKVFTRGSHTALLSTGQLKITDTNEKHVNRLVINAPITKLGKIIEPQNIITQRPENRTFSRMTQRGNINPNANLHRMASNTLQIPNDKNITQTDSDIFSMPFDEELYQQLRGAPGDPIYYDFR